jgi:uncharacterized protein (DUF2141 family)
MKIIYIIIICNLLIPAILDAKGKTNYGSIVLKILEIKNEQGTIKCSLHNNKNNFPSDYKKSVMNIQTTITKLGAIVIFDKTPYGVYAISCFHDENNDEKLKKNFWGIPKEGIGVSLVQERKRPKWENSVFSLSAPTMQLDIHMFYY